MKNKRWIALLLSLILCLQASLVLAASEVTFSVECSTPTSDTPAVGDHLTYTVRITQNDGGFYGGTFFFRPSENLSYVSATLRGDDFAATKVETAGGDNVAEDVLQNVGAYGIEVMDDLFEESDVDYCTITFRVTDIGQTSLDCYIYQFYDGSGERRVELGELVHTVAEPSKPTVLTETLTKAVMGQGYSFTLTSDPAEFLTWRLADDSRLPEGLSLSADGVLSGTPTVFGENFTFSVIASAPGGVDSEPKELTLTILEKPQKLELTDNSSYQIGEDGYLRKVVEDTTCDDLLTHFLYAESIKIFAADGSEILTSGTRVGTGSLVCLMDGDTPVHTLTILVLGDVDGNGRIGAVDYRLIRNHYKDISPLEGAYLLAADVDDNGRIGAVDYRNVRWHYKDTINLFEN